MGKILMPGGGKNADLDMVTAKKTDVRAGKVIVDQDGESVTGTLTDRGAWSYSNLAGGAMVKIPAGIHDGNGIVTAAVPADLESQTPGTATAVKLLSGETAWVKGKQITGSMPNKGAWSYSGLSGGSEVTIPRGYHDGTGSVSATAPASLESQTPGTAIASQVLYGKTAWVAGKQITGSMPNKGAWSYSGLSGGSQVAIPKGYHDGTGIVSAIAPDSLESQTPATATASKLLSGETAWVKGKQIVGTMPDQNLKDSLGGFSYSYSSIPIHKGSNRAFTTTTGSGERLLAVRPGKGYWDGNTYVAVPAQSKSVAPSTSQQIISADSGKVLEDVTVSEIQTQIKTVTAGTSMKYVTPDSGKYLAEVDIYPTPTQSKSVTPTTLQQTVSPDSGKHLSSVVVSAIQTQTKTVTPETKQKTVTPDSGKYLSSVTVGAVPTLESQTPGTAISANILSGKTAWVAGEQVTGSMPDQSSKDSLGGINSNYPNVAIHKGTQPQFTQPTATGAERMFALRPDRGYWNGDTYVAVPVQSKSITPTTSQQTVSSDSGNVLEKVTVGAIPSQRGTSQKTVKCYSHTQSDGVTYLINWIPGGWYTAWQNDSSGNAVYAEIWTKQADVAAAFGITAAKLKKGVTIAGITGTWEGYISDPVDLWKDGINNDGMTFDSNWGTSGTILWTAQNYAYVATKKTYNLKKYSKLKIWTWYDSNRTTPESGNVSLLIAGSIPFVKDMYTVGQDFNRSSVAAWTEFDLSGLACNAQLKIRISCGINISHIRLE